jgi:hypothetical protein
MVSTLIARSYPCAAISNDEKKIHQKRNIARSIMHDAERHGIVALDRSRPEWVQGVPMTAAQAWRPRCGSAAA